jgi:hypothetical protein
MLERFPIPLGMETAPSSGFGAKLVRWILKFLSVAQQTPVGASIQKPH